MVPPAPHMTLGIRPPVHDNTSEAAARQDIALDQAHPAPLPARVFYSLDSRRVTLAEYWRGSPSGILGLALLKLFRVRVPTSIDDPSVETLAPFQVDASLVPPTIVQRSGVALHQLASLGFRSAIWHVIEDDVSQTPGRDNCGPPVAPAI